MGSHWAVGKLGSDVMGLVLGKKTVCGSACPGEWIGGGERGRRSADVGKKKVLSVQSLD